MIAVNVGEDRTAVEAFAQDHPMDFEVLLDPSGETSRRWGVTGMPTTFLVDLTGKITQRMIGKREWDSLELLKRVIDLSK